MKIGRHGGFLWKKIEDKYMKLEELQGKTVEQLEGSLSDLKKEAFNLRFQKVNGQLENTSRVRIVRRSVARVKTLINQNSEKKLES